MAQRVKATFIMVLKTLKTIFMLNSKCYAVTTPATGTCLDIVLWCHADVDILNCCRNIFVLSACLLIACGKEQLIIELHSKFVSQTKSPSADV